jgi:hypothetical protein
MDFQYPYIYPLKSCYWLNMLYIGMAVVISFISLRIDVFSFHNKFFLSQFQSSIENFYSFQILYA